jgi:hypothetical protein
MNDVCVIATFLACRDPRADPGNPILTYLMPDGIVRYIANIGCSGSSATDPDTPRERRRGTA